MPNLAIGLRYKDVANRIFGALIPTDSHVEPREYLSRMDKIRTSIGVSGDQLGYYAIGR